jgi:MoaA/NifB/PqqE/SkfB family radical SAM enzyme
LVALQIEVTSRCSRTCAICPRAPLGDRWQSADMEERVWEQIRRHLHLARHIHLQGWGEPLLHPGIREMAAAAREAGCATGITTNGDLLAGAVPWILAERVDLVCVSVAGATETHSTLRGGSDAADVWHAVRALTAARRRRRHPRVEISMLLTRDNAPDLAGIVRTAATAGADAVYVTHLDVRPSPELEAFAAFGPEGLRAGVAAALDAARLAARETGIDLRLPATQASEMLVCAANPLDIVFVCYDGRVVPCVCLGLPAAGPVPRANAAGLDAVDPFSYGHLARRSLDDVVEGPERAGFLAPFAARLAAERRFLARVSDYAGPDALRDLDDADDCRSADLGRAPWPDACRGCPKTEGW